MTRKETHEMWDCLLRDAADPLPKPKLPPRMEPNAITQAVGVFQPRHLTGQFSVSEEHIKSLTRVLINGGDLDAIHVWWSGRRWYVVDGHHRLQVYRRFKDKQTRERRDMPVVELLGTDGEPLDLQQAVAYAAKANSKDTLTMSIDDKTSMAWRLVCMSTLSKRQIAESCGIGERTVATQRQTLKVLLEMYKDQTPGSLAESRWWQARMMLNKEPEEYDHDAKLKADIEKMARRLQKDYGGKLTKVPEVVAGAIAMYDAGLPLALLRSKQWEKLVKKLASERADDLAMLQESNPWDAWDETYKDDPLDY